MIGDLIWARGSMRTLLAATVVLASIAAYAASPAELAPSPSAKRDFSPWTGNGSVAQAEGKCMCMTGSSIACRTRAQCTQLAGLCQQDC